jgi:hypothetical protein
LKACWLGARNDKRRADLQKQLELPPFPSELHHVWRCFIRLSNRRPSTGFGGGMIPFSEIEAFNGSPDTVFTVGGRADRNA